MTPNRPTLQASGERSLEPATIIGCVSRQPTTCAQGGEHLYEMSSISEDEFNEHEELTLPYSVEEQLEGFKKLRSGSIVQISFDPYHSLKSLRDQELDQISPTMRRRRHLALILSQRGRLVDDIPICTVEYMLVAEGLPEYNARRGIDSDMCIPILPCTSHPERRAPLASSPAFHLPNHYVHTSQIYVSRVGKVSGDGVAIVAQISVDDLQWVRKTQRRDYNHGFQFRMAEKHRVSMSQSTPHTPWEEEDGIEETDNSKIETESLTSVPVSEGIDWVTEITELRKQLSQLPDDQMEVREVLMEEGVDDSDDIIKPLALGQCRWRETTVDIWLDREEWSACAPARDFPREWERLCK